jgi:hypothetical protein
MDMFQVKEDTQESVHKQNTTSQKKARGPIVVGEVIALAILILSIFSSKMLAFRFSACPINTLDLTG